MSSTDAHFIGILIPILTGFSLQSFFTYFPFDFFISYRLALFFKEILRTSFFLDLVTEILMLSNMLDYYTSIFGWSLSNFFSYCLLAFFFSYCFYIAIFFALAFSVYCSITISSRWARNCYFLLYFCFISSCCHLKISALRLDVKKD